MDDDDNGNDNHNYIDDDDDNDDALMMIVIITVHVPPFKHGCDPQTLLTPELQFCPVKPVFGVKEK